MGKWNFSVSRCLASYVLPIAHSLVPRAYSLPYSPLPSASSPRNGGHCLVEVIIAMAAGVVVLSAAQQSLIHFQHRLYSQQETMGQQQDARLGLRILEAELRAAAGASLAGPAMLKANAEETEFLANLNALITTVTATAAAGQQELKVLDGSGWPRGKRIIACSAERCVEARLARDGQRFALSLAEPLTMDIPAGSSVSVSNQVRYYLGEARTGRPSLMRQVDGGANSLISDVTQFRLGYLDQEGRITQDPAQVSRVRVELTVGESPRGIVTEVGLRGRL